MRVHVKRRAFARPIVTMVIGLAGMAGLAFSSYPGQVIGGLTWNLRLAAASALACALMFSFSALFLAAGARGFLGYTTVLDLTDTGCTLTRKLRPTKHYARSDIARLLCVPNVGEPRLWVLLFVDGRGFAANADSVNFREGMRWIRQELRVEEADARLEDIDPSLAIPRWLRALPARSRSED